MRSFFLTFSLFILGCSLFSLQYLEKPDTSIHESLLTAVEVHHRSDGKYEIHAETRFPTKRTSFYFAFPRPTFSDSGHVAVVWENGGESVVKELDTDDLDMHGYESRVFSIPWITRARDRITFSIISDEKIDPSTIQLISSYSESESALVGVESAHAGVRIVSRAEWGADESYRYADSDLQKKSYQEFLTYAQSPKTQEQIDAIKKDQLRQAELERLYPDTEKSVSIIRTENGHPLYWPIEKTRTVNRIIIHHTAENMEVDAADEVYIKEIYKYHAVTRGWGDIGYNYIIGQRGVIYEGRAGGDYVIGAHTPANNAGSVGISVIGNFENLHLNRDQKKGLETAITYVAEKYGITLSSKVSAIYSCKYTKTCDAVETHLVNALSGHRDYNPTACPGANIYSELPGFIRTLDRPYTLIPYAGSTRIDSLPTSEHINMTVIPGQSSTIRNNTQTFTPVKTVKSPNIKIKLSYTGTTAVLDGVTVTPPVARLGLRKLSFGQGDRASISVVGKKDIRIQIGAKVYTGAIFSLEGELARVASWVRVPAWDTAGKYNDNIFRGKLIVRNQSGSLVIINELPIEDYIKGLGEVSNGDPVEKVKTILVAARSYAYYYMDKSHRKYGTLLYDGSDDPDSFQKYLGYSYELRSPNVSKLADETRGQVIKYKGELIKPWYFSSSDGRTLSYTEYCSLNGGKNCITIPYLSSVSDPGGAGKVRIGHGVGISGVGATYFAGQGWDYKKIIQYYLNGVEIMKK